MHILINNNRSNKTIQKSYSLLKIQHFRNMIEPTSFLKINELFALLEKESVYEEEICRN